MSGKVLAELSSEPAGTPVEEELIKRGQK